MGDFLSEIKMVQKRGYRKGSQGLVSFCVEMRRFFCIKVEVKVVRKEKILLLLVIFWNKYGDIVNIIINYQRFKEQQILVELFILYVLFFRFLNIYRF